MCMRKHSGTLKNLLFSSDSPLFKRLFEEVCFSPLKKQCYSMLIQLLYVQSTELFPFYRRITIQEMSGIWVFLPSIPQVFSTSRGTETGGWGWSSYWRQNSYATGAPGIPRWGSLEAFGAPKVVDEIRVSTEYISSAELEEEDSFQENFPHTHLPFKILLSLLFLLRWFCHFWFGLISAYLGLAWGWACCLSQRAHLCFCS